MLKKLVRLRANILIWATHKLITFLVLQSGGFISKYIIKMILHFVQEETTPRYLVSLPMTHQYLRLYKCVILDIFASAYFLYLS